MLQEKIEKSRDITYKSLDNYMWSLKTLYKSMETKMKFDSLNWVNNTDKINDFLEGYKPTTRKNFISAIVVALSTEPNRHQKLLGYYKEQLNQLFKEQEALQQSQELTETQKKNWTTMASLKKVAVDYRKEVNKIMDRGSPFSKKDIATYQEYLLSMLYTEMPPLRNDYAGMVITYDETNLDADTNYFVVGEEVCYFVLNNYKTKKQYGSQIIDIPEEVYPVVTAWLGLNPTKFFLINNKNNPLNSNGLTKLLNKVFSSTGKKISSGLLRHIYLSERYEANEKKKMKDAKSMLHSVATQQKVYVKKIPT
jgi:hypothetical protein